MQSNGQQHQVVWVDVPVSYLIPFYIFFFFLHINERVNSHFPHQFTTFFIAIYHFFYSYLPLFYSYLSFLYRFSVPRYIYKLLQTSISYTWTLPESLGFADVVVRQVRQLILFNEG